MPRVLAVDPSLRSTGFAVLDGEARDAVLLTSGIVKNKASLSQGACLVAIREALADAIEAHGPEVCVVEGIIWVQNNRTAITMGAARGAALIAAAEAGLPIYEYAPRRAKQAVVGRGAADKSQVAFMVRSLLKLQATPPGDVADACAIGLAHLQAIASGQVDPHLGNRI